MKNSFRKLLALVLTLGLLVSLVPSMTVLAADDDKPFSVFSTTIGVNVLYDESGPVAQFFWEPPILGTLDSVDIYLVVSRQPNINTVDWMFSDYLYYEQFSCAYYEQFPGPVLLSEIYGWEIGIFYVNVFVTNGSHELWSAYDMVEVEIEPPDKEPEHEHDFTGDLFVLPQTCTDDGYAAYVCTCGEEQVVFTWGALGHDLSVPIGHEDATCEEDGYNALKCSRCNETKTDPIAALEHAYTESITLPTCVDGGFTTFTCSRCDSSYVSDRVNALGHDWDDGEVTIDPTELKEGELTYTCQNCGETRPEAIPILGHTHNYTGSVVTNPTCTERGFTTHACTCGAEYSDSYTNPFGHDLSVPTGHEDATCEDDGYDTFKCIRCNETRTDPIAALNHDWTNNNDGTHDCANGCIAGERCLPDGAGEVCAKCGYVTPTEPTEDPSDPDDPSDDPNDPNSPTNPGTGDPDDTTGSDDTTSPGTNNPIGPTNPNTNNPSQDNSSTDDSNTNNNNGSTRPPSQPTTPNGNNTDNLNGNNTVIPDERLPLGSFPAVNNPFEDVDEDDWFYGDVMVIYTYGLMTGISADPMLFGPNILTTRGMIVTILHRMAGSPAVGGGIPFSDVASGMYYTDAVIWAEANGIVAGYGNGKYGPMDSLTIEQLAVILNNYAIFAGLTLPEVRSYPGFDDDADISGYAEDAIKRLYAAGIIDSKSGKIDPKGNVTRAEVAAILEAFLDATDED